ncbi:MAG: hypothetical protein R3F61_04255 [Myxococcota bacterium]
MRAWLEDDACILLTAGTVPHHDPVELTADDARRLAKALLELAAALDAPFEGRIWVVNVDRRMYVRETADSPWVEVPVDLAVSSTHEVGSLAIATFAVRDHDAQPVIAAYRLDGVKLWSATASDLPLPVPPGRSAHLVVRDGELQVGCGNDSCALVDAEGPVWGPVVHWGS